MTSGGVCPTIQGHRDVAASNLFTELNFNKTMYLSENRRKMKKTISLGSILSLALLMTFSAVNPAWSVTQDGNMVVLNPGGGKLPDGSDGIRIHINDFKSNTGRSRQLGSDQIYFTDKTNWVGSGVGPTLAIGKDGAWDVLGNSGLHTELGIDGEGLRTFTFMKSSGATGAFQEVAAGIRDDEVTYAATTGSAGVTFLYRASSEYRYEITRKITYTFPNTYYDEEWTVTIPAGHPADKEVKLFVGGNTGPGGSDTGTGLLREADGLKTIYSSSPDSGQFIAYSELDANSKWTRYFSGAFGSNVEIIPGEAGSNDIITEINEATHNTELHVQWSLGSTPGTFTKSMRTTVGLNANIPAAPLDIRPLDLDLSLDATVGEIVPGGQVRLQGGGLIANSPLSLVMRSTPVDIPLNGRTADRSGNFDFLATLPASISAGVHSLTLTGTKPDGNPIDDVLYFEIDAAGKLLWSQADTPKAAPAAAAPAAPAALAKTGTDSWETMSLLAYALVIAGYGLSKLAPRLEEEAY
jgi:hypothetical protein